MATFRESGGPRICGSCKDRGISSRTEPHTPPTPRKDHVILRSTPKSPGIHMTRAEAEAIVKKHPHATFA